MSLPEAPQRRRRQRVPRRQQLPVAPGGWLVGLLQRFRLQPPLLGGTEGMPVVQDLRLSGPLAGLLGPVPPRLLLHPAPLRLRGRAPLLPVAGVVGRGFGSWSTLTGQRSRSSCDG